MSAPTASADSAEVKLPTGTFLGHPKGLFLIFTAEMWERMSYYGMRALLTIYMIDKTRGGFGWDEKDALHIYGWYTGLVYLTPLIGGYLADRFLGQRRAVVIGGLLMMLGHFAMAMPGTVAFFSALALLIVGNGFFKPNLASMVGGLYRKGDARRDAAYTIYYMGVNTGAFLAPLLCGTLGERIGWHWGFGSAGVGMALGVLVFVLFSKRLLGSVGAVPAPRVKKGPQQTHPPLTREDIHRLLVIVILAVFVILFWASFEQAGGLFSIYTEQKIDRNVLGFTIPTSWLQAVNPLFIVLLGPIFSAIWTRLGRAGKDPSIPTKMGLGILFTSMGFLFMMGAASQSANGGKAALGWMVATYFIHTMGELCLSPVGLSMVSKLAPARFVSLCMGVWYLSNFIGNLLSGVIGGYAQQLGEFQLFGAIAAVTAATGVLLIIVAGPLRKMMHGADAILPSPPSDPPHPMVPPSAAPAVAPQRHLA